MLSRVFMQLLFLWVLSMQNASTQRSSNCMFGVFSLILPLRPLVTSHSMRVLTRNIPFET